MKYFFIILCLVRCAVFQAQTPDKLLDQWAENSPIQKVHLHLDRENFIAGETVWFKAYLYSDYQPDTISTVLYTELADASGKTIVKFSSPVLFGVANGFMELPDSLRVGNFQLRSYTPTMLNQGTDFVSRQHIFIYGREKQNPGILPGSVRLEFFPEGGNLLAGVSNVIAFKATNEQGLPATVKGKLYNEKNQEQVSFSSYHDGMGLFEFTPVLNEKYYAVVEEDATAGRFSLPVATLKTVALLVMQHPRGYLFELKQNAADPVFHAAYMVGQMQHHVVFKQDLTRSKNEIGGIIDTRKLLSGILQITFFNKDHQPVAERLCFVNNREYIQNGKLSLDTVSFAAKGRNRFSIQLPDTVRGSFSVSVTDAGYELSAEREQNIYSSLLMTGDLQGYVQNPAWYFRGDNDSVKTALDLVMMTNGWRRFKWTELPSLIKRKEKYKDPSFITLEGKITLRDSKKPFDEKPLLMMLVTADSTRRVQMLHTNKEGRFFIDSLLFFGKSRIMFADIRGKKSQFIDAHLFTDTSLNNYKLPTVPTPLRNDRIFLATQSKYPVDYEKIFKEQGLLMEGVTVTASRKKTPLEILDEKYASGAFGTEARKVFDLVNTDEARYYNNIMDFLRAKGFSPNYRTITSNASLGEYTADLYLDEFETDEEILETLPMSQVAMVKIYTTFSGSWGNGPGGAIAVYTKKGEDLWNSVDARPSVMTYSGYSLTKEFYAPDYSVPENRKQPDSRITLEWRPDIRVNNVNPRIPFSFYNNDRTKKFKVVVEGMTVDGKMLMIEETYSQNP